MPQLTSRTDIAEADVPLVVDVDGTLVAGNLLVEASLGLFARSPLGFLRTIPRLLKGRAALKRAVAEAAPSPPSYFVTNPVVVDEIKNAKQMGRPVWLASGADELAVKPFARQLETEGHLASDGEINLVGKAKADALVERFGNHGFDYVGNALADLPIWECARKVLVVDASARLRRKARGLNGGATFLPGVGERIDYLRALRPHHWVKNVLVFVAVLAAHTTDVQPYLAAAAAFTILSMVAAGAYVINDLLDIHHDRQHASKRFRPIASGKVRLPVMLAVGAGLLCTGIGGAFWLSTGLGAYVALYVVMAVAYSSWLKRAMFVDVILLASMYVVRVLAGSAVASIPVSPWLLAFSMFVFVSLATVKRRKELAALTEGGSRAVVGRGYVAADAPLISMIGAASAIGSVIVFALYIQSPEMATRYDQPQVLWLACPLLLYWLGRLLLLSNRGQIDDDPVVFAARDWISWATGLLMVTVLVVAV